MRRISTLPSRDAADSFTLPAQSTNTPRGICPSANSSALSGKMLGCPIELNPDTTSGEKLQNHDAPLSLQSPQWSTIPMPYGVFIKHSPLPNPPLVLVVESLMRCYHCLHFVIHLGLAGEVQEFRLVRIS
jgi:hypothetical protein